MGLHQNFIIKYSTRTCFDVKLYPHNHDLGAEVLLGQLGKSSWRMRLSQKLSGMNPDATSSAQSIMCIAKRLY